MKEKKANMNDKEEERNENQINEGVLIGDTIKRDIPEDGLIILTNREPIIDKINTKTGEVVKSARDKKNRRPWIFKICPCINRKEKESVNIPSSDWTGPVDCQVLKSKNFRTKDKAFSNLENRKMTSTHESIQTAWENSVKNHILTRKAVINQSKRESFKTFTEKIMKGREKFKVYSTEKLCVTTTNQERPHCKSFYTIKHVKKRRKQGILKCYHCGAEGTKNCQIKHF